MNPEQFMQNNREADAYILFYNLKKNSQIIITKLNKVNNKLMNAQRVVSGTTSDLFTFQV